MAVNIFIVEDNLFYGKLLKSELEKRHPGSVTLFNSVDRFIHQMDKHPDIIILDHHLGNYLGVDLVKQLRSSHPKSQVIILSGQNNMRVAVNAFKYGAYDYVEKNQKTFKKLDFLIKKIQFEISERKYKQMQRVVSCVSIGLVVSLLMVWIFY